MSDKLIASDEEFEDKNILKSIENIEKQMGILYLVDCSGSMDNFVDGKHLWEHARDALKKCGAENIICFGEKDGKHAWWGSIEDIQPTGSTPMEDAFILTKQSSYKYDKVILISDGEPNYKGAVKEELRDFKYKVDTIYIGKDWGGGEDFLKEVAAMTGGTHATIAQASKFGGLLEQHITLLIGSAAGNDGTINL
jgi:hypothetical protein